MTKAYKAWRQARGVFRALDAAKAAIEYEKLTAKIARLIFENVEHVPVNRVGHGRPNKIPGGSTFPHQIDVSVHGERDLLLIECKCWSKIVSAESLLVFTSRLHDISRAHEGGQTIHGILVTTFGFSAGVHTLAKFFGIQLGVVRSPEDFVLKYKEVISAALSDNLAHWKDRVDLSLNGVNPDQDDGRWPS